MARLNVPPPQEEREREGDEHTRSERLLLLVLSAATMPGIVDETTRHTMRIRHHTTIRPGAKSAGCFLPKTKIQCILFVMSSFVTIHQLLLHDQIIVATLLDDPMVHRPTAAPLITTRRSTTTNTSPYPRFLWGIATVNSGMEYRRRTILRETYLSDHRVCSFLDYLSQSDSSSNQNAFEQCILFYAFFMGGNQHGAKDLCDANESVPLSLEQPLLEYDVIDKNSSDIVFLNIQENQFEGKMTTWFKYAVSTLQKHARLNSTVQYVVKADSDTMLYTNEFFEATKAYLPTNPVRIFAGVPMHWAWHHEEATRDIASEWQKEGMMLYPYVGGQVEILSIDLAKHVTSPGLNRSRLARFGTTEDTRLGEYVWSHPQNATLVALNTEGPLLWAHQKGTKRPKVLKQLWHEYKGNVSQALI